MDSKYLYLLLNIGSFIVPFCFSFYIKASFFRQWKYYLPGIFITAVFFILWDQWFTRIGVWGFSARYISGYYLFGLPIEEILFFFCIPYACTFTYFAVSHLVRRDPLAALHKQVTLGLIAISIVMAIAYYDRWYTLITFSLLAMLLLFIAVNKRATFPGRFYLTFLIILFPFFLVNGTLTGFWSTEPVVWYNNNENIGIRLGTIPIEDIFYAMLMLLTSISIAEYLRDKKNSPSSGLSKQNAI